MKGNRIDSRCVPLLLAIALVAVLPSPALGLEGGIDRVMLISIDSMNSDYLFETRHNPDFSLTPNMGGLVRGGTAFPRAECVLPSVTQVNHMTMVCGCRADRMGIVGNAVYRVDEKAIFDWLKISWPWRHPDLIVAETLFDAMSRADTGLTSAVVAGKNFVGCPIRADIQVGPACVSRSTKEAFPHFRKFPEVIGWDSPDRWVMDMALEVIEARDPDVAFIHLPFVDPVQHYFGHGSTEAWAAVAWADAQVGRLLDLLRRSGKLGRTLIILTADHGQTNIWRPVAPDEMLAEEGIECEVYPEGPFANIFLQRRGDLERAVGRLEASGIFDGIWYGNLIDGAGLRTPYTGDILVSMRPPFDTMVYFAAAPHLGAHGGLSTMTVPIIFFGPSVDRGVVSVEQASLTDIVPTLCRLTGLPLPRDVQGTVLPVENSSFDLAPEIDVFLKKGEAGGTGFLPIIFIAIALALLVAVLAQEGNHRVLFFDASVFRAGSPGPLTGTALTLSTALSICSAFFVLFHDLYASVPGIPPDAYITSMLPSIHGGSYIIFLPIVAGLMWFGHWSVGGLILWAAARRIVKTGPGALLRHLPLTFTPMAVGMGAYTVVHLFTRLPAHPAFFAFQFLFWGDMLLMGLWSLVLVQEMSGAPAGRALFPALLFTGLTALNWFSLFFLFLFAHVLPIDWVF